MTTKATTSIIASTPLTMNNSGNTEHGKKKTKKRGRQESEIGQRNHPPLGALEFASALNGDDPRAVWVALKRFTKTVRRQRRLALSNRDGPDEDEELTDQEEEEVEEMLEDRKTKKLKEDWMEDTKEYKVPFVGTSVARGDTGTLRQGVWPTGLLEAYLKTSPLATELTSNESLVPPSGYIHKALHRSKQYKASHAIYRAYLEALAELFTANVPIYILRQDIPVDVKEGSSVIEEGSKHPRLVSVFMRNHLVDMLGLIGKEASKLGKGESSDLAAPAVDIVANLAGTSVGAGREVVRGMESAFRPGVLYGLLSRRPSSQNEHGGKTEDGTSRPKRQRDTCVACLRLCCVLLELRDNMVVSYIATGGSKERKIQAGALYIALRRGLKDIPDDYHNEFYKVVSRLLRTIRMLLPEHSKRSVESGRPRASDKSLSTRALADLLGGAALENIAFLASLAAFDGRDLSRETSTPIEQVRVGARRVLVPLLVDPERSPFLERIHQHDDNISSTFAQQIVRAMLRLLEQDSTSIHMFIAEILCKTPALAPHFFKKLAIPDPASIPRFLHRTSLIRRIMRDGPTPSAIMQAMDTTDSENVHQFLLCAIPENMKKHTLSRAVQSANQLVVTEALKLIALVLRRHSEVIRILRDEHGNTNSRLGFQVLGNKALEDRLPDIRTILSISSKLDPFQDLRFSAVNAIICGYIYEVLERFALVIPHTLTELSFDWTKLLPPTVEAFCSASASFQFRLLSTLDRLLLMQNNLDIHRLSSEKGIHILLQITMTSKLGSIYKLARSIFLRLFGSLYSSVGSEHAESLHYEAAMWVDGLTDEILDEFCRLIHGISSEPLNHTILLVRAWDQSGGIHRIPHLSVSPVLTGALNTLRSLTAPLSLLVCQIAAKCIVFHMNPLPLASVVHCALSNDPTINPTSLEQPERIAGLPAFTSTLLQYCQHLLSHDWTQNVDRSAMLDVMLTSLFPQRCVNRVANLESSDDWSRCLDVSPKRRDDLTALRQCLHTLTILNSEENSERLRFLLPLVVQNGLQSGNHSGMDALFRHSFVSSGMLPLAEVSFLFCVLLSCPMRGENPLSVNLPPLLYNLQEAQRGDATKKIIGPNSLRMILHLYMLRSLGVAETGHQSATDLLGLSCRMIQDSASFDTSSSLIIPILTNFLKDTPSLSIDALSTAWLTFVRMPSQNMPSIMDFVSLLEKEIGDAVLQGSTDNSARLCAQLATESLEMIISSSFRSQLAVWECGNRDSYHVSSEGGSEWHFLVALVGIDIVRYGKCFLTHVVKNASQPEVETLWRNGRLDKLVSMISNNSALCESSEYTIVLNTLTHRFINSKTLAIASGSLDDMIDALYNSAHNLSTRQNELIAGVLLASMSTQMAAQRESDNLVSLAARLSVADNDFANKAALSSAVFIGLLQRLQRLLKKSAKDRIPPVDLKSSFSRIAEQAFFFTREGILQGNELLSDGLDTITTALRACVKYGIANCLTVGLSDIAALSLRVVRFVISHANRQSSALYELRLHCPLANPWQVFQMVVSHSHFENAIRPQKVVTGESVCEGDEATEELLLLMLCCLELHPIMSMLKGDLLKILLSAYDGGLSPKNMVLKRIFILCSGGDAKPERSDEEEQLFMDDFRVQNADGLVPSDTTTDRWEWLINMLDVSRVRATLCQFPVSDSLTSDPDALTGTGNVEAADKHQAELKSSSGEPQLPSGTDEERSDEGKMEVLMSQDTGEWTGEGPDIRYSPAFTLPMILAALESHFLLLEETSLKGRSSLDGLKAPADATGFVQVAQQLCDKGALSLALACLCSDCSRIRQVAVATLRHFLLALESQEGRSMTTWRERPQLAMLGNAVQRGLVIRRVAVLSSMSRGDPSAQNPLVPKLSPLSAIFLARSALILSKPGDPMFSPINRYFLKDEESHGAFQETTRFPAFVSFFCSSSDETGQARRERMWALRLLKDGFTDETCYHAVSSCHAPELMLTCFNGLVARRNDSNNDHERILLLDTLTNLLRRGGRRAAIHLLGRMGLLSWLRAQLVSSSISLLLPSRESKTAFVRLVAVTAKRGVLATDESSAQTSRREAAALMDPLLALCMDGDPIDLRIMDSPLAAIVCEAVEALGVMLMAMTPHAESLGSELQPDGLSHERSTCFLSSLSSALVHRVLSAICCCPMTPLSRKGSGVALCCAILYRVRHDGGWVGISLARVQRIIRQLENLPLDTDSVDSILRALLHARQECFCSTDERTLWFDCLEALLDTVPSAGSSELVRLCRNISHGR